MGFIRSTLILLFGMAVGGALLLAYRVSQETGKSIPESLPDVPGEAMKVYEDLRVRATDALKAGREAYVEKQAEMGERMRGGPRPE